MALGNILRRGGDFIGRRREQGTLGGLFEVHLDCDLVVILWVSGPESVVYKLRSLRASKT